MLSPVLYPLHLPPSVHSPPTSHVTSYYYLLSSHISHCCFLSLYLLTLWSFRLHAITTLHYISDPFCPSTGGWQSRWQTPPSSRPFLRPLGDSAASAMTMTGPLILWVALPWLPLPPWSSLLAWHSFLWLRAVEAWLPLLWSHCCSFHAMQ